MRFLGGQVVKAQRREKADHALWRLARHLSQRVLRGGRRVRRHVGGKLPLRLPGERVRGIRRIDEVDIEDARGIFLRDAREG